MEYSISDLRRSQDECADIDVWLHPSEVVGHDQTSACSTAMARAVDPSPDQDFIDTPDTLITDHLRRCLDRRRELLSAGKQLPPGLEVSPIQYIDALVFLVLQLESSYACYGLGSAAYQTDDFISAAHATEILERLQSALYRANNSHQWDMIRDITLEVFRLAYPWIGEEIRYSESLSEPQRDFLIDLLKHGAKSPAPGR